MERSQLAGKLVDHKHKGLAKLRVATLVGLASNRKSAESMTLKCTCVAILFAVLCGAVAFSLAEDAKAPANTRSDSDEDAAVPIRDVWFTTSDGVHIHYLAAGQMKDAPPLVFIPGWTVTAFLWSQQLRTFSTSRLVIAVDSRSQEESSVALSGNTPEGRATDLHELITSLQIAKFVVVGWSQGGQDVAAYIQEYGTDTLASIVFVDSTVSYGPAEIDTHKEFAKFILSRLAFTTSIRPSSEKGWCDPSSASHTRIWTFSM